MRENLAGDSFIINFRFMLKVLGQFLIGLAIFNIATTLYIFYDYLLTGEHHWIWNSSNVDFFGIGFGLCITAIFLAGGGSFLYFEWYKD